MQVQSIGRFNSLKTLLSIQQMPKIMTMRFPSNADNEIDLFIHIADVSSYVRVDDENDRVAKYALQLLL